MTTRAPCAEAADAGAGCAETPPHSINRHEVTAMTLNMADSLIISLPRSVRVRVENAGPARAAGSEIDHEPRLKDPDGVVVRGVDGVQDQLTADRPLDRVRELEPVEHFADVLGV